MGSFTQPKAEKSTPILGEVDLFIEMLSENLKNLVETLVEQELDEMPIANYKTIGNFDKASSIKNPVDRRLLSNPRAIDKIKRQWEKTPYDFDIYVMNDKRVNGPNREQFYERGEVTIDFVRNKMKLTPEEFPDPTGNNITVIFTNNNGDERYMASGWILAHRVGHVFARGMSTMNDWEFFTKHVREVFRDLLSGVYDIDLRYMDRTEADNILKNLAHQIGSMKSARDNNLRNWYEFAYELFAQYLLTGKITFRPLPNSVVTKVAAFGRETRTSVYSPEQHQMYNNHDLDYYATNMDTFIENVLDRAVGRIFVM